MVDDRSRGDRNEPHGAEPDESAARSVQDGPIFSTDEAAAALGLSEAAIHRAIADGDLAATRPRGGFQITAGELVRFARRQNLPVPLVTRARLVPVPLPPVDDLPSALPIPGSSLIGRGPEVERLTTLLLNPAIRLVTLTGPGGVGKTRLALAAAEALQKRFADGALFVDLSAVTRTADAIPAIAQALGLREAAGLDQRQQIAGFLGAKEVLLVLDNVEQIIDAAPEFARIVGQASGTTLLVTSRAPLRVRGEREMPVPLLPLAARDATPDELLASDAGRLFVERATARDPSFAVDEQSAPLIAEICTRLDGLPLAIELAAARVRLLTPRQLRDRLERTLVLLTHGDRDAPRRHLTMRDAIGWSYDLLAPDEQHFFRQLAVFAGGFTLDAAEWVGERDPERAGASAPTLDRLEALIDQSLVVREVGADGEPRFRLLETIRAYALERLAAADDTGIRDAHARYFLALTRALRPMVATESARAPLERLAADDPNLRAALAWLADQESAADFVAMVADLSMYWFAYSNLRDAGYWIERALTTRHQASQADQARLLIGFAVLSGFRGDDAATELTFAEALPLSRAAGDAFDVAMALTTRGAVFNHYERFADAAVVLEEGRAVAASVAEPRQRAAMTGRALANLSVTARGQGDFATATALSEAALTSCQGFGFDLAETRSLMDLAGIAQAQNDLRSMVARCQTCLAQTGERGDMRVVCVALSAIADACLAWDQPGNAALLYAAADAVRERVGLAPSFLSDPAVTTRNLATLRTMLNDVRFDATWAEGRALPLARVLSIAATVTPEAGGQKTALPVAPSLLTRREREVLRLLAMGQSDRDIAEALFIGTRTVSWHVGAILGKLGVTTRREAANKAHIDGLL